MEIMELIPRSRAAPVVRGKPKYSFFAIASPSYECSYLLPPSSSEVLTILLMDLPRSMPQLNGWAVRRSRLADYQLWFFASLFSYPSQICAHCSFTPCIVAAFPPRRSTNRHSESAYRSRLQTAVSCCHPTAGVVNVTVKRREEITSCVD